MESSAGSLRTSQRIKQDKHLEETDPNQVFQDVKELVTKNNFKIENHLDEFSYCKYVASQQIIIFKQDTFFVDLFIQLIQNLRKVLNNLKKRNIPEDSEISWYFDYSRTLMAQIVDFVEPLKLINATDKLLKDYTQSEEMMILYACLLSILRFMEGISWGYSPMLMH